MVPGFSNGLEQGNELPTNGTAAGGECHVCSRRFSHMYYPGSGGIYCAQHVPSKMRADGQSVPATKEED